jgi:hypothetical protein
LSADEREEVLRHRISYFADDLRGSYVEQRVHPRHGDGAQAAIEILEFANSQLLEFRYYDQLLDGELARIYPQLQRGVGCTTGSRAAIHAQPGRCTRSSSTSTS